LLYLRHPLQEDLTVPFRAFHMPLIQPSISLLLTPMPDSWNLLLKIATEVVSETIASLPPDLQSHANAVPVLYQSTPDRALLQEGWEPDLLGLYSGDSVHVGIGESTAVPREIRLFLKNLWDFAEEDEEAYREEVRITYLHEFGHYLGLDEEDLEDRDLI
jgi:predicted Zn-dependent protease with MMP-like domain